MAAVKNEKRDKTGSGPDRNVILVSKPMFWGIRNIMTLTKINKEWQPSWNFKMAAIKNEKWE